MMFKLTTLFFIFLVAGTVLGCGSSQPQKTTPAPDPCNFEDQARTVWNPEVKTELTLPLKILQGTFEAQEAEMLTTKLDLFTDDWISMRRSVCQEQLAGDMMSNDAYQAKVDCFNSILEIQQTIIRFIKEDDRAVLEQISYLSQAIEPCIAADRENNEAIRLNPFEK
jgi:hypothetical protein